MTMYVSKVWGFDNPCEPMCFSTAGWHENAVGRLQPGDLIILVGTFGDETAPEDRNCVLGMMEPTTELILSADFLTGAAADKRLFKEDDSYRWPFGLLNRRAWEFEPGLLLAVLICTES